ncbi:MAG: hypothetical protein GY765_12975 [bacterium]|nr:hypothetical protein [bacterium]
MKRSYLFPIIFLIFFPLAGNPPKEKPQPYWEVDFDIAITGTYSFNTDNVPRTGKYSFHIQLAAVIEQDFSKDFILYQGRYQVLDMNWKEEIPSADGKTRIRNLAEDVEPAVILNYVLKERGKLFFDMEMCIKPSASSDTPVLKRIILPRSARNKVMHPDDKYNKGLAKRGTNQVAIKERPVLKNEEAEKSFNWTWKRKEDSFSQTHSVNMKLQLTKKIEKS